MAPPRFSFTGSSGSRIPMGDLIAHHADLDPEAPLLVFGDRIVTRQQFEARANQRARMLAGHGVVAGDLVAIALPNGLEFYETVFASWKLGATPNPLSSALTDGELAAVVDVGAPRLVVGVDPARLHGVAVLPSQPELPGRYGDEPLPSIVTRYWKAMPSGGSTGRPKIIVDHMPGEWDPAEGGLAQRAGERVLNAGPLYHNGPFLATMLALFSGGVVFEMGRFDPQAMLAAIERHRISWLLLVPTMMHRIMRLPDGERHAFDMSSVKTVVHTAAPCPPWLKQAWIDWLGADVMLEVYTGTERQAAFTITGGEAIDRPGSVGRIAPGSKVRVLDATGQEVPSGEIGEIFLRPDTGHGSTYHYLGAEPRVRGEWESLGDLGRIDADGYLYLSDRRTDLIIRGGANIYPAEVEAAIDAHPAVVSSIVVGLPDSDLGEVVHAIVQQAPERSLDSETLRAFLSNHLVHYKIPKTFEFVDHPLRDDAGKARRSALRAARAKETAA